jgi:hypothetical protein
MDNPCAMHDELLIAPFFVAPLIIGDFCSLHLSTAWNEYQQAMEYRSTGVVFIIEHTFGALGASTNVAPMIPLTEKFPFEIERLPCWSTTDFSPYLFVRTRTSGTGWPLA